MSVYTILCPFKVEDKNIVEDTHLLINLFEYIPSEDIRRTIELCLTELGMFHVPSNSKTYNVFFKKGLVRDNGKLINEKCQFPRESVLELIQDWTTSPEDAMDQMIEWLKGHIEETMEEEIELCRQDYLDNLVFIHRLFNRIYGSSYELAGNSMYKHTEILLVEMKKSLFFLGDNDQLTISFFTSLKELDEINPKVAEIVHLFNVGQYNVFHLTNSGLAEQSLLEYIYQKRSHLYIMNTYKKGKELEWSKEEVDELNHVLILCKDVNLKKVFPSMTLAIPKNVQFCMNEYNKYIMHYHMDKAIAIKDKQNIYILSYDTKEKECMFLPLKQDGMDDESVVNLLINGTHDANLSMHVSKISFHNNLKRDVVMEATMFTEEGIHIALDRNKTYMDKYASLHRMIPKESEDRQNIELLKIIAAEMFQLIDACEQSMHKRGRTKVSKKYKDAEKARMFLINDFKRLHKRILRAESNFNFAEYYRENDYTTKTYKITTESLIYIKNLLQRVLLSK